MTRCLSTCMEEDPLGHGEGKMNVSPVLSKGALSGSRPNLSLLQRTCLLGNESLLKVSRAPPCRCCLGSHQHDR